MVFLSFFSVGLKTRSSRKCSTPMTDSAFGVRYWRSSMAEELQCIERSCCSYLHWDSRSLSFTYTFFSTADIILDHHIWLSSIRDAELRSRYGRSCQMEHITTRSRNPNTSFISTTSSSITWFVNSVGSIDLLLTSGVAASVGHWPKLKQ